MIAVEEVPREDTHKYGIVDATPVSDRAAKIKLVVEKPKPAVAPSNLAIVGRYVLPGRIFELLEKTTPGAGGEIQLTDAIEALLRSSRCSPIASTARASIAATSSASSRRRCTWRLQDPQIGAATRRCSGCRFRDSRSVERRTHREQSCRESSDPNPGLIAMDLSWILNHLGEDREQYFGAVAPPILQSSIFAFPTVAKMREGFRDELGEPRLHARQQPDRRNPAQESRGARRRRGLPDVRQRRRRDLGRGHREPSRRRSRDLRRAAVQLDARRAARPARSLRRRRRASSTAPTSRISSAR